MHKEEDYVLEAKKNIPGRIHIRRKEKVVQVKKSI